MGQTEAAGMSALSEVWRAKRKHTLNSYCCNFWGYSWMLTWQAKLTEVMNESFIKGCKICLKDTRLTGTALAVVWLVETAPRVDAWDSFPNSLALLLLPSNLGRPTDELLRLVLSFSGHRASTVKGWKREADREGYVFPNRRPQWWVRRQGAWQANQLQSSTVWSRWNPLKLTKIDRVQTAALTPSSQGQPRTLSLN